MLFPADKIQISSFYFIFFINFFFLIRGLGGWPVAKNMWLHHQLPPPRWRLLCFVLIQKYICSTKVRRAGWNKDVRKRRLRSAPNRWGYYFVVTSFSCSPKTFQIVSRLKRRWLEILVPHGNGPLALWSHTGFFYLFIYFFLFFFWKMQQIKTITIKGRRLRHWLIFETKRRGVASLSSQNKVALQKEKKRFIAVYTFPPKNWLH